MECSRGSGEECGRLVVTKGFEGEKKVHYMIRGRCEIRAAGLGELVVPVLAQGGKSGPGNFCRYGRYSHVSG